MELYPTMQCAQTSMSSVINELKQSALGFNLFLEALFDLIELSKFERYYNLVYRLTHRKCPDYKRVIIGIDFL